jgi:rhodanese-related sulfurtransferase
MFLPTILFADDYFQPIPMAEVARIKNRPDVVVLDVNPQDVWEKHHIPGAVHVESEELTKYLPPDKKFTLIFYCAGPLCRESANAANSSIVLGYRRVFVMTDGIFTWVKAGYPVESSPPAKKHAPGASHGDKDHGNHHM